MQVVTPAPGGPADRAGLQAGDIILAIDGKPTNGASLFDAGDMLQGAEGSEVSAAVVLCCSVLCCAIAVLCYAVLCCAVQQTAYYNQRQTLLCCSRVFERAALCRTAQCQRLALGC